MGNNNVCLAEQSVNNLSRKRTPDTKWSREDLKSGSCVQTMIEKENVNFFKTVQCGPAIPYYKNELSRHRWAEALQDQIGSTVLGSQLILKDNKKINLENVKKLEELIMLGPPKYLRWQSWITLMIKKNKHINYENYLEKSATDELNIIKDINRTLITHALFKHESCGQEQLKRVLCAISNALPSMGYCQGMNFICGLLLIVSGCDEHQTFQMFMSMLINENHLLCFNFCNEMPLHYFITQIIHYQIKKKFPKLNLQDVSDSFWLSKMIFSLFIYVFKLDDCIRCWDYLLARGMIRGIPELILGFIDVTYNQLIQFTLDDFGSNFQGHETTQLQFNVGEMIYVAKEKHSLSREFIAKLAKKIKKQKQSQLLDLLQHFDNQQIYNKNVQYYIKTIFDLY